MSKLLFSPENEEILENLAQELAVPEGRYEAAERSYESLGKWLHREASSVRQFDPQVYVQGSFRLGTTIRPLNDHEEYDVDSVCEFRKLAKSQLSQKNLKDRLGAEIEAYRKAQNMTKPLREGRRCWVLDYADGAQFHMDIVPALSDPARVRTILAAQGLDTRWTNTAIAITDNEAASYFQISDDWPRSNPKGYSEWFRSRMADALNIRKKRLAESVRASVEDIPDYRVRTPLQSAAMILKHHRDVTFQARADVRPISVILTTLAAHAYSGEETIGRALATILDGMDRYIQQRGTIYWIPNPTDPLENFADKWEKHPERARAFFEWLTKARLDFGSTAQSTNRRVITEAIAKGVGAELADRAMRRGVPPKSPTLLKTASIAPVTGGLTFPDKSRVPTKPEGFGSAV